MEKITKTISPLWSKDNAPLFLSRTETNYVSIPRTQLQKRSINDPFLDSILDILPDGAYVVGGAVASILSSSNTSKDIDIAFTGENAFKQCLSLILGGATNSKEDNESPFKGYEIQEDPDAFFKDTSSFRFLSFKHSTRPPIQLLKLAWYDDPFHIIDSFDFTVVQFALNKNTLYFNPLSVLDLARKRIVLHRMQFPASTMRRLVKYTAKGFYVCQGSFIDIADAIQKHKGDIDINSPEFFYLD